jgi:hypothetical protein
MAFTQQLAHYMPALRQRALTPPHDAPKRSPARPLSSMASCQTRQRRARRALRANGSCRAALQGQTAGRSYSTLALPTGSACGRAASGKLASRNLAHPAVPSPSCAASANCSAAAAKLGLCGAARFFEVLTAAWRRPRAARSRAARAQLVGQKLEHQAVPSLSRAVPSSSTQPPTLP